MTKITKIALANSMSCFVAAALLVGCQNKGNLHGEKMYDSSSPTQLGIINENQAASGARADATLSEKHFQGAQVNSLGQVKLDLISKGTHADEQIVVYLNVSHDSFEARGGVEV